MKAELKRRFRVRYARLVVLEVEHEYPVNPEDPDTPLARMDCGELPGVYEGVPDELLPKHVDDVQDYEHLWVIEPLGEPYLDEDADSEHEQEIPR